MPGVGSLIREIKVKIKQIEESKQTFAKLKTKPASVSRRQIKIDSKLSKNSKLLNFITLFGITVENTSK